MAQNNIGFLYHHGLGVSKNYKVAMEWYQTAAFNGNTDAQYNIDAMYQHGLDISQN
jgi:TPR repeat protein